MSLRALQRQWYAKLGPDILEEGPDGEGRLSDRGHLHPVTETPDEDARLADRTKEGEAYTAWALSVLHDGPAFPTREAREAWRLHAEGLSEREIGTTLTITRKKVRRLLSETRKRVSKVSRGKRWLDQKKQRRARIKRLVRQSDPAILLKLVAVMMRQAGLSSP